MQRIAVIATNEMDFVKSITGENTAVAKQGGILINDFLYIPIKHENDLRGNNFDGIIITKDAKDSDRLRYLFNKTFSYIRI